MWELDECRAWLVLELCLQEIKRTEAELWGVRMWEGFTLGRWGSYCRSTWRWTGSGRVRCRRSFVPCWWTSFFVLLLSSSLLPIIIIEHIRTAIIKSIVIQTLSGVCAGGYLALISLQLLTHLLWPRDRKDETLKNPRLVQWLSASSRSWNRIMRPIRYFRTQGYILTLHRCLFGLADSDYSMDMVGFLVSVFWE